MFCPFYLQEVPSPPKASMLVLHAIVNVEEDDKIFDVDEEEKLLDNSYIPKRRANPSLLQEVWPSGPHRGGQQTSWLLLKNFHFTKEDKLFLDMEEEY